MAHATPFVLYARFKDAASLERFLFFIEEETRPDFPDEVESAEVHWVEHFEFLPFPWELRRLDRAVLAYFGDPHEEEDLHRDIAPMMEGAAGLGAARVMVYWSYEGEGVFERYAGGRRRVIGVIDDSGSFEERGITAGAVTGPMAEQLQEEAEEDPGKALLTLARLLD